MDMNIFIRQNFGRGVAFKNFISWRLKADSSTTLQRYRGTMEVHKNCFLLNGFAAMLQAT